jgi:hypothetical protein
MEGQLTITFRPDGESRPLAYHVHRQMMFEQEFKPFGVSIKSCPPFRIPVPIPDRGHQTTHTKTTEYGEHLQFWGEIYQPWHFLIAERTDATMDPRGDWKPEPDDDEFRA